MQLIQPEVLRLAAEQTQQVPGQPLTGVKATVDGVSLDLAEHDVVNGLQGLLLDRGLRVHHSRHHAQQPRLLHHSARLFSLAGESINMQRCEKTNNQNPNTRRAELFSDESGWEQLTASSCPTHCRAFFFTDTLGSLVRSASADRFSQLRGMASCFRRPVRA